MVSSWWRFLVGIEITPPAVRRVKAGQTHAPTRVGSTTEGAWGLCWRPAGRPQRMVRCSWSGLKAPGSVQDLVRCVGADPGAFWADQDEERVVPEGNLRRIVAPR